MEKNAPKLRTILIAGLILIAALVFINVLTTGAAPVPPIFHERLTLDEAIDRARQENKLVMAFTTADWCGPCQRFKAGALVDTDVETWVRHNAVPVYVDVERDQETAMRLGVRGIPMVVLMRDGEQIARTTGAIPPGQFLEWLREAAG